MRKLILFTLTSFASVFAQTSPQSPVPGALRPPSGQVLLFKAHGVGDQIYTCKASAPEPAWTLKAPEARLLNPEGQPMGRHFAGPTWEANDGSAITGKVVAKAASPDPHAIPWLLLETTTHKGHGAMAPVVSVQRLNTKGGNAPTNGCDSSHPETERRVPYEADYYFFGAAE